MKLLVIGAGNMGLTYAKSIQQSGISGQERIMLLEVDEQKATALREEGLFDVYMQAEDCVSKAEIIMLAVKPQIAPSVFESIKALVKPEQLIISIMAGMKIATISQGLGIAKVVRAMPNLPSQIGLGMTTFTYGEEVSQAEGDTVAQLLDTTGKAIPVKSEVDIDKSTGISGSGPAYIFYFLEALIEAGKTMGFDEETAKLLATQTFDGAVQLFKQSDLSPEEWMNRVASKGGTTRAALDSFMGNKVSEQIQEGAIAAFNRAEELGKQ